jgi:hypothetical protein
MLRAVRFARFAAVLAFSLLMAQLSAGQHGETGMAQIDNAVEHLHKFQRTNSLHELDQAVANLEVADVDSIERERTARGWIAVFRTLDGARDHAFDPSDVPAISIIPPTVNGVTHPAGVSPSAISDPIARVQYEKQLSANQAKSERYTFQYGLQRIDKRATASFEFYASRLYSSSASDRDELERLVREGGLTAARSEQILTSARVR